MTGRWKTVPHRRKHGSVGPDLRMAVHAGLGGRNAGKARILNRGVAIAAIQPQAGGVMLMAEWDRLLRSNVLRGYIRRALKLHERRAHCRKQEYYPENAGASQSIRTAVKDLCH